MKVTKWPVGAGSGDYVKKCRPVVALLHIKKVPDFFSHGKINPAALRH